MWSIQPTDVAASILDGQTFRCDVSKSELLEEPDFVRAYAWMSKHMDERLHHPEKCVSPVWAWSKWDGDRRPPDFRSAMFKKSFPENYSVIEIDVHPDRVLLSDFDSYNNILNNLPCWNDEEWDAHEEIPVDEMMRLAPATWDRIFNVDDSDCVQACLWEIHPEDVVRVKPRSGKWRHRRSHDA